MIQSWSTELIILKRVDSGEGDRIVTGYSPELGKIVSIAKGARKLQSTKRSFLEPGNWITVQFRGSRGLPFMQQVVLKSDFHSAKKTLMGMKQVLQVLEIVDKLTVEGEGSQDVFFRFLEILQGLHQGDSFQITKDRLWLLLAELGYRSEGMEHDSISEVVEEVADRPLNSYAFLTVYNTSLSH